MFWRMTPREFSALMRGKMRASRNDLARIVSGAWHTAAFMFVRTPGKKQLPTLDRIIRAITGAKKREQTVEEQMKIVRGLNAKFGGKVKKIGAGD